MGEFRNRRFEVGQIKAEQIKATDAKIVATSCHNCIDQISELSRHYKLGLKVKNTCELVADALIIPGRESQATFTGAETISGLDRSTIIVDNSGYLEEPSQWDWNVAQYLANEQRMGELTQDHRQILEYVRKYYSHYHAWPVPQRIHKDTGINPGSLFPSTPESVFKVAGLGSPKNRIPWGTDNLPNHD